MSELALFVGPKKTGTSWLHHVITSNDDEKEIRFPSRIGTSYVYNNYVHKKRVLIWPYLLHDTSSLKSLLSNLNKREQTFKIYISMRDQKSWETSMKKFSMKYGASKEKSEKELRDEIKIVEDNVSFLEKNYDVVRVQIIEPSSKDLELLARATGVRQELLQRKRDNRIYESTESSRISSSFLVKCFFKLKAFLPRPIQRVTRNKKIRQVFFRNDS